MFKTKQAKVLIIESDDFFRKKLSEHLKFGKYKVFELSNATDIGEFLNNNDIDVVLLCIKGFKQISLSILKEIKKKSPFTEVILIVPLDDLSLSIEGMKLGAFDDLLIPFDIETLLQKVKAAFNQKKERAKLKNLKTIISILGGIILCLIHNQKILTGKDPFLFFWDLLFSF
ncbi:MAG: response regulator [Desulfobacterales bacterium]|nr:response regulator [Desulfobacterales bacterium]MBF0396955.1 response regulator [Desulfobacterales bacterium]